MTKLIRPFEALLPIAFVLGLACHGAGPKSSQALQVPAAEAEDSIVRFFYQPNPSSYFHVALVFRAVSEADPKWNTAPVQDVGRTAYITGSEMDGILRKLSDLRLPWVRSNVVEPLETYKTIHSFAGMNVKVLSSKTTATAAIRPEDICSTLAALDQVLQTPRALWEFQRFRTQYNCRAPNFNAKAYPD